MELLNLTAVHRIRALDGGAHGLMPGPGWAAATGASAASLQKGAAPSGPADNAAVSSSPSTPSTPVLSFSQPAAVVATAAAAAATGPVPPLLLRSQSACGAAHEPPPKRTGIDRPSAADPELQSCDPRSRQGSRTASGGGGPEGHGTRALRAALRQALTTAGSLHAENLELRVRLELIESLLAAADSERRSHVAPAGGPSPPPPRLLLRSESSNAGMSGRRRLMYDQHPMSEAGAGYEEEEDMRRGRYLCLVPLPLSQWWGARGRAVNALVSLPSKRGPSGSKNGSDHGAASCSASGDTSSGLSARSGTSDGSDGSDCSSQPARLLVETPPTPDEPQPFLIMVPPRFQGNDSDLDKPHAGAAVVIGSVDAAGRPRGAALPASPDGRNEGAPVSGLAVSPANDARQGFDAEAGGDVAVPGAAAASGSFMAASCFPPRPAVLHRRYSWRRRTDCGYPSAYMSL